MQLDPSEEILDGGCQILDLLGLCLVSDSESGDLGLKGTDVLSQGGETGSHPGLYLSQALFTVIVIVVCGVLY